MFRLLYLLLKPYKSLIIIILMIILLTFGFINLDNISMTIISFSIGIYIGLFFIFLYKKNNPTNTFISTKLLFSLPIDKNQLLKSIYLSLYIIMIFVVKLIILEYYIISLINDNFTFFKKAIVSIIDIGLIITTAFNIIIFLEYTKNNHIYKLLTFIFGFILIQYTNIIIFYFKKSLYYTIIYSLIVLFINILSFYLSYKIAQNKFKYFEIK